jgi:hypothetical protein
MTEEEREEREERWKVWKLDQDLTKGRTEDLTTID